jgi:hypothetical protein
MGTDPLTNIPLSVERCVVEELCKERLGDSYKVMWHKVVAVNEIDANCITFKARVPEMIINRFWGCNKKEEELLGSELFLSCIDWCM